MIWPPLKAWTSIFPINKQRHFVAINYGGKLLDRWVILISVLDSNVVAKVSWEQLLDSSKWICGWDEDDSSSFCDLPDYNEELITNCCIHPSIDSGLTIPITNTMIRPWFRNI